MGREIRRVPADWKHPKFTKDQIKYDWQKDEYHPLFDSDYQSTCAKWYKEAKEFKQDGTCHWYHEYAGDPPNEEYYRIRAWTAEEATHYQMYETVSEGTPVTPVFGTPEELIEYLVKHGDFWDQHRGEGGWNRENAVRFVGSGYAPSAIVDRTADAVSIKMPRDQ